MSDAGTTRDESYVIMRLGEEVTGVVRRVHELFEALDATPHWRVLTVRRRRREVIRWLELLNDLLDERQLAISRKQAQDQLP